MHRFVRALINGLLIVVGVLAAGFGLKGFLLSSHFIDGGVTGISMLLANIFQWALCLTFVKYPDVTSDKLLTAVFGGFFIGAGIGLAIRGGAVLDGTEIAALVISKSSHILKVGDVILLLNVLIFSAAGFFLGVEVALYSMLTYFAASKTIDFLLHGVEEHTAIMVISQRNDEIRHALIRDLRRGVTVFKGRGGLSDTDQDILLCVVTRLEIGRVKTLVHEFDSEAFVMVHGLADAEGGVIKRRALHA
jgi:uncharacterized membrane-anchored protein YitT (DUF2179 family)